MSERQKDYATKVYVHGPSDFNSAVRRFSRRVDSFGILQEVKERQHYVKKSTKRRKKKQQCRRNNDNQKQYS